MLTTIIMILTGLMAGILSAILGIGGGIIMLPATQLLLKFDAPTAVATTLLAVALTSFSGAFGHYRKGRVQAKKALLISSGGILGILIGSYVFKTYLIKNTFYIEILLGLLFLFMAYKMLKELYSEIKKQEKTKAETKFVSPIWFVVLGMLVGTLTGMLGLGGGFIMVPALMWLFGLEPLEAVGTTLLAMLPITLFGALIKLGQGFVNVSAGLMIGFGSIFGAQIGVRISSLINPIIFKGLFSIIFIYLACSYLLPML